MGDPGMQGRETEPGRVRLLEPAALRELDAAFELLESGYCVVLGGGGTGGPPGDGAWLGLRTSGTTAVPRLIWHRWSELRRGTVQMTGLEGRGWASPFRPDSYAGVQVALHAWVSRGSCCGLRGPWAAIWADLESMRPDVLCCTPTFLDLLMFAESDTAPRAGWQPRQLTLGGEPLRARIGERARLRFPEARLTVVYASAEAGVIAKSHRYDGWFEAADLDRRWDGWRVAEGSLQLRRDSTWVETGDRIEEVGGRFRVLGRAGGIANVAGTKVWLAEVESAAEEVPGVLAARASAEPNTITGQVVGLRFATEPGVDPRGVQAALEGHLRERLRKEAWPRCWECVPRLLLGPNAKKAL
jgi:acyl-coenzyme A synthetase/AMP-(fatty) acid ligase